MLVYYPLSVKGDITLLIKRFISLLQIIINMSQNIVAHNYALIDNQVTINNIVATFLTVYHYKYNYKMLRNVVSIVNILYMFDNFTTKAFEADYKTWHCILLF